MNRDLYAPASVKPLASASGTDHRHTCGECHCGPQGADPIYCPIRADVVAPDRSACLEGRSR